MVESEVFSEAVELWCCRHNMGAHYQTQYDLMQPVLDHFLIKEVQDWGLLFYIDLLAEGMQLAYFAKWYKTACISAIKSGQLDASYVRANIRVYGSEQMNLNMAAVIDARAEAVFRTLALSIIIHH